MVTHRPVGIAVLVTPWNFPAAMATRKIAPALAAGCTVLLKPAAETPLTAIAIAGLLTEAGLPDGVLNVVPTTNAGGVVTTWLEDPRVRKISFTGSTGIGRRCCGRPPTAWSTHRWNWAATRPSSSPPTPTSTRPSNGAMIAKFRNGGQACTAANRFYIHADIADDFAARLGNGSPP